MSRSPWRDAIDGQIKVLRELRQTSAKIHLGRSGNVDEVNTYFPDPQRRAQFLYQFGETLAEAIETLIREAEPIHLTHDIDQAIQRQVERLRYEVAADKTTPFVLELARQPLMEDLIPVNSGLLYFSGQGLPIRSSINPEDPDIPVFVRAIYFGDEPIMEVFEHPLTKDLRIDARTRGPHQAREGLGLILFLDARQSGFTHLANDFGDHLVPVPLGAWKYGETLSEAADRGGHTATAFQVDKEGTAILLTWTGMYLYILFRMMLQRLTLWGGVGLNRTEQRETERERLRPRVQLVTWRKANYQYPDGHIPVPKNWSCRWSVKEHYRRYRSGKVVKIRSYVKGPEHKPFRLPVSRVHEVKR